MKESEVTEQQIRIEKWRNLAIVRDQTRAAIKRITEPWAAGPCEQGPFTGNTRESRLIQSMHIEFTKTRGGASAASIDIPEMMIEACEVGRFLETMLGARLKSIEAEMEAI